MPSTIPAPSERRPPRPATRHGAHALSLGPVALGILGLGAVVLGIGALPAAATATPAAELPGAATATARSWPAPPRLGPAPRLPGLRFPRVELHGYFRFRPDWISNGHLGQAVASDLPQYPVVTASSIKPPLSRWPQNNDSSNGFSAKVGNSREEDSVAAATMRLRLQPTIHVSDNIRLRLTVDAFDNYTLGSAPDYAGALARPDVPLVAFAMSTAPQALRLVEAYGEWKTPVGVIRAGRQASQWGLGILANGGMGNGWDGNRPTAPATRVSALPAAGSGYDADFGNFADRLMFVTGFGGTYVAAFWDFVSQGSLAYDRTRIDGVAFDLEDDDDVNQWGLSLFRRPVAPAELVQRRHDLDLRRVGVLDWGVYAIYRTQELDTEQVKDPTTKQVLTPSQTDASHAGSLRLLPRQAWAVAGDLWARYEIRPQPSIRLVAEAEGVYLHGKIGDASPVGDPAKARPKSLGMWGGALKAAWQYDNITIGLDAGAASGDDTRCFGVYGPGNCGLETASGDSNETVTGFKFHRNYRVDSLLFRDVIGAVTNTWFVKPSFGLTRRPWYDANDIMGFDLGILHAQAMVAGGTPGNGSTLGTEVEARAFVGSRDLYLTTVTFAYLVPGDALDVVGADGGGGRGQWLGALQTVEAQNAWRLMVRMVLSF